MSWQVSERWHVVFVAARSQEKPRRKPGFRSLRHPQMEPLEDRVLLSIDTEIRRALIIGISDYSTPRYRAVGGHYAASDAQAFEPSC